VRGKDPRLSLWRFTRNRMILDAGIYAPMLGGKDEGA
jgi:hypothetical protein